MLSSSDYIRASMEYNLFWVRIMMEHAIFIAASMPPPLKHLGQQAAQFQQQYAALMEEAIRLSSGIVSRGAIQSGQYYTKYTEAAEKAVQQLTGIDTNMPLTLAEYNIAPLTGINFQPQTEQSVSQLNRSLLELTNKFAEFKSDLLNNQRACRIFTFLYTADLHHVLEEAKKFIAILNGLQNKDETYNTDYHEFWSQNMSDHAKSMRGLFDPTETAFIGEANRYAQVFDALVQRPETRALPETKELSDFKATVTQGMLVCRVKSIMNPLYTDHLLREANHYIYLLLP